MPGLFTAPMTCILILMRPREQALFLCQRKAEFVFNMILWSNNYNLIVFSVILDCCSLL